MPIQYLKIKDSTPPPPPPPKTKKEERKDFWMKNRWAIIGAIILLIAIAGLVYFLISVLGDFNSEGSGIFLVV